LAALEVHLLRAQEQKVQQEQHKVKTARSNPINTTKRSNSTANIANITPNHPRPASAQSLRSSTATAKTSSKPITSKTTAIITRAVSTSPPRRKTLDQTWPRYKDLLPSAPELDPYSSPPSSIYSSDTEPEISHHSHTSQKATPKPSRAVRTGNHTYGEAESDEDALNLDLMIYPSWWGHREHTPSKPFLHQKYGYLQEYPPLPKKPKNKNKKNDKDEVQSRYMERYEGQKLRRSASVDRYGSLGTSVARSVEGSRGGGFHITDGYNKEEDEEEQHDGDDGPEDPKESKRQDLDAEVEAYQGRVLASEHFVPRHLSQNRESKGFKNQTERKKYGGSDVAVVSWDHLKKADEGEGEGEGGGYLSSASIGSEGRGRSVLRQSHQHISKNGKLQRKDHHIHWDTDDGWKSDEAIDNELRRARLKTNARKGQATTVAPITGVVDVDDGAVVHGVKVDRDGVMPWSCKSLFLKHLLP
jgi:hypothetical protein